MYIVIDPSPHLRGGEGVTNLRVIISAYLLLENEDHVDMDTDNAKDQINQSARKVQSLVLPG